MLFDFGDWRTSIDGLLFERLGVQEVVKLEEPFSGEKVLGALMGLNGDKAPSLNGFPMAF